MRIIAVIPAYNEGKRVGKVVAEAKKYVDLVVVVNDGSTDDTAKSAEKAGAIVLTHIENCGAGAATMTGIDAARELKAQIIVTLDADEQHNSDDIPALLKPIKEDKADIAFANRFGLRNNIPFIRRLFNGLGNVITFVATGKWVRDSQCGFKVFGPKAVRQIDLRMSGYEFCTEIVRECTQHRWRVAEVPAKVLYSEYTLAKGQSFANGVRTALKILLRSFLR
ncbi:dolichyl-phosphate mannose synthase [bacterium]|jgi:glycosyltransferase involved in cell wall biosynthesis|nr:dolichyl-phosphate mannose synthase [bacterium]|tara:strand:+ start:24623 stop:25291 length:669 start_codon:yes stop_codon:yes gene_type:complete